ncbi:MAG: hypothetical protein J0L63_11510 [Anaerolineae bacterium]|nr:hypothetical protein [Anaerolineae bacterium]
MNPADVLNYGHLHVLRTLEDLNESDWQVGGVCGVWSVQNILSHLISYELWLTEILAPFAKMSSEYMLMEQKRVMGNDAFNEMQVTQRKGYTPAEIRQEYIESCRYNLEVVAPLIPQTTWSTNGTLPWYGSEYALDDFIVYTFYGHKREHCAQIEVFKDSLERRQ